MVRRVAEAGRGVPRRAQRIRDGHGDQLVLREDAARARSQIGGGDTVWYDIRGGDRLCVLRLLEGGVGNYSAVADCERGGVHAYAAQSESDEHFPEGEFLRVSLLLLVVVVGGGGGSYAGCSDWVRLLCVVLGLV